MWKFRYSLTEREKFCIWGNVTALFKRTIKNFWRKVRPLRSIPNSGSRCAGMLYACSKKLDYAGAATVEFLVDDGKHYFMEVNVRVQVEHPVTEMITGVDIIREQILACTEGRMNISQASCTIQGYALETRVNALTPGKVTDFDPPAGPFVRTDTFLYSGCNVSPHYDSMVAKVIIWAPDRMTGLARMSRVLREIRIEGIKTNIDEQLTILESPQFRSGNFGTSLYGKLITE